MMTQFKPSVGPYTYVSRDEKIAHGDRHFRILLYGAYNAMGLIGPEANGICILDEDLMQVVLDEHCCIETGYFGPSQKQIDEYERIKKMSAKEFVAFVNSHPRLRDPIELKIKAKRRPKLVLSKFIEDCKDYQWTDKSKKAWMQDCERVLRMIAARMGLNEDQYDIRHNPGGPAVSGDVMLHTDRLYVNFSKSSLGPDYGFMYRRCEHRKDYTGRSNLWMKWDHLLDLDKVAATLKEVADQP